MLQPDKYDEAMTLILEIGVKYPRVAHRIMEHLDEAKLESIFDSYVIDSRQNRRGFHSETFSKIMALRQMFTFKSDAEKAKFL